MKVLTAEDLKRECDISILNFETTADLEEKEVLIGQKKGADAIKFGLNVKSEGYNIYVAGESGTGKTTYATKFAREQAEKENSPNDLVYVNNFKNPKKPILIELPKGIGIELKEDVEEVITLIQDELPRAYNDKNLEEKKNQIIKKFQSEKDLIIKNLSDEVKEDNFGVKSSTNGIYLMPIKDGELLSEEEFEELSEEEKDEISKNSEAVNMKAAEIIQNIKDHEYQVSKKLDEIDYTVALFIVGKYFSKLIEKYEELECEKLNKYFFDMKENILDNIDEFVTIEEEVDDGLQGLLPFIGKQGKEDICENYKVNLFLDNSKTEGAPVIVEYNPNYSNLIGEIEYESEGNAVTTSYMKIKAGSLHKAKGGYLIIQAYDLLSNGAVYEALRRCLKSKKITIETAKENASGVTISALAPEDCPMDVKIILVGTRYYYDLISYHDDDFKKYFKILSSFDYEMDLNEENAIEIAHYIKYFVEKNKAIHFDKNAVSKIINYSQRLAENIEKLTTNFNDISQILAESTTWASLEGKDIVTGTLVDKTIKHKIYRTNDYEEKLTELIDKDVIMIDTKSRVVGQINGLAVIDTGKYSFGKPVKITATTYIGNAGIVNIEKEADMSGNIHDKGVQVLSGFLGETYAQNFPLCLSARICFEQSYSGIDGDSASSTELYAMLSSLSGVPIKQSIAVTGSINQKGMIQPIGGVTQKVEGFFDLCKKRGLTGEEGVIIPIQNVKDLVLRDEVIEAISFGYFSIYAIENVSEGMLLLTDQVMGEIDDKGVYPPYSINGRAYEKLKNFYNKSIKK